MDEVSDKVRYKVGDLRITFLAKEDPGSIPGNLILSQQILKSCQQYTFSGYRMLKHTRQYTFSGWRILT